MVSATSIIPKSNINARNAFLNFFRLKFDGYFEMTTKLISLGKLLNHLSN